MRPNSETTNTRRRATSKSEVSREPTPITGFDAALAQVAAIFGSADAVIRIRAIHPLKNREERDKSVEVQGTLAELRERLVTLNAAGYNNYLIPQPHGPPSGTQVADADVTGINCLFTDNDKAVNATPDHHVSPSFTLIHPKTKYRWDVWLTDKKTFPLADFTPMQKRLAKHYESDPKVINPGRIVRLAGFDRWKKGENFGPYDFFRGTMDTTAHWQHQGLPALADVPHHKGTGEVIEWDNARAHANNERAPELDTVIVPWDLPESVTLAIEWLNTEAKVSVLGSQGNNTAYATAAKMCSYGLSQRKAFEVLLKHWAPKCEPAWTNGVDPRNEKKLRDIITNAYYYNKKPPGGHTPAYRAAKLGIKPVEGAESEPATANDDDDDIPYLIDGPELAKQPQVEWIVKGVQAKRAYTSASGRSGAGKTTGERALGYSIASTIPIGKIWLGMPVLTTGPVLTIEAEGQDRSWDDMRAWCDQFGVDPESLRRKFFTYVRAIRLNTDEGHKLLKKVLERIKRITGSYPVYVIVDTLRGNMKGSVSKEEDAEEVLEVASELRDLGIAVTLIAHHGRGHGETKGLTDWEDAADQVRHYTGKVKDRDTKITFHKVKAGESGRVMAVGYELRQLPDDHAAMVAISGAWEGDTASLFNKAGTDTQDKLEPGELPKNDRRRNLRPDYQEMVDNELEKVFAKIGGGTWSALALGNGLKGTGKFPNITADGLSRGIIKVLTNKEGTHAFRCAQRGTGTMTYQWKAPEPFYEHSKVWAK